MKLLKILGVKKNYICTCRKITEKEIVKAIKGGADTYEKVLIESGAGTGKCKGIKCEEKIENLLEKYKK